MRSESDFLRDMLDSAARIQRELTAKSYSDFQTDETLQDAIVLRLAVIGEAAKKISANTRAAIPDVPFDEIAKMRDVLTHVYWRIDYKIVWDTVDQDVPVLVEKVKAYLDASASSGTTAP